MILKEVCRALPLVAAVVVVVAALVVVEVAAAVVVAEVVKAPATDGGTTTDENLTVAVMKTPESVGIGGGKTIHDRTAGKTMRLVEEEADSAEEGGEEHLLEEGEEDVDSLQEGTGTLHAAMTHG
jgi:hypothetical protein